MRCFTPSGSRADVHAADDSRPAGGFEEAAEHADGRGLAGAVRAEKAEDLAGFDVERQSSTAVKGPNRRVRSFTEIAVATSPPERAIEPRFREPDAGERTRAIELRLEQGDLRVQHLGRRRHADVETLGTTRRASAALRAPSSPP